MEIIKIFLCVSGFIGTGIFLDHNRIIEHPAAWASFGIVWVLIMQYILTTGD